MTKEDRDYDTKRHTGRLHGILVRPGCYRRYRYAAVLILFLVFFFFSTANPYRLYKNGRRIAVLRKELARTQQRYHDDSVQLEGTRNNKAGIEHTARERFMMKAPDEMIFLIVDTAEQHISANNK